MTTPLDLSALHPAPAVERTLRWFYPYDEGHDRLTSSHEQLVQMAMVGPASSRTPAAGWEVSERAHEAALLARKVRRTLAACSSFDRRVLAAAYGGITLTRRESAEWSRLAPVGMAPPLLRLAASRLRVELDVLLGYTDKDGKHHKADKAALKRLVAQANEMLACAASAYETATPRRAR